MSDIGFQQNHFVTTPIESIDPMGEAVWRGLQPDGSDARALRSAIDRVDDEQLKAERRVERLQDERQRALIRGTETSLTSIDMRLTRAAKWLERVTALAAALPNELTAAEEREAAASRELARRQAAARQVIERYRTWVTKEYTRHAQAIADGMRLEQEALASARAAGLVGEMPMAHTGDGNPRSHRPTTFSAMVRLPSATPGPAIAWPDGEPHPSAGEYASPYAPVRQG